MKRSLEVDHITEPKIEPKIEPTFDQCEVKSTLQFVDGIRYDPLTIDDNFDGSSSEVVSSGLETVFRNIFPIENTAYEKLYPVTTNSNFGVKLTTNLIVNNVIVTFDLFRVKYITSDVITEFIKKNSKEPVGSFLTLEAQCYSYNYNAQTLFPCIITLKKLKFGLIISEVVITIPNDAARAMFKKLCNLHTIYKYGPCNEKNLV